MMVPSDMPNCEIRRQPNSGYTRAATVGSIFEPPLMTISHDERSYLLLSSKFSMFITIAGTIGMCVILSFSISLQISSVRGEVLIMTLPPKVKAPWMPGAARTML